MDKLGLVVVVVLLVVAAVEVDGLLFSRQVRHDQHRHFFLLIVCLWLNGKKPGQQSTVTARRATAAAAF